MYVKQLMRWWFVSTAVMVSVFPKSPLSLFPLIELLGGAAGYQMHGFGNGFSLPVVQYEKMDVVGCDCTV